MYEKKRLGDILIEAGIITEEQLTDALDFQKESGIRIGRALVEKGYVTGEQIAAALSAQLSIPYVRIADYNITPELIKLIPEKVAKRHKILPIEVVGDRLVLAIADPLDIAALDDISLMLGYYVEPVIAAEAEIMKSINQYYQEMESVEDLVDDLTDDDVEILGDTPGSDLAVDASQAEQGPVIKYVNAIILNALRDRASDIHIEPFEHAFYIRERIDGVLQLFPPPPRNIQSGIISRVKVMANLNIAETRLPQDGRIRMKLAKKEIDMRVSTLPTMFGESVVLRLLDRSSTMIEIDALGMQKEQREIYRRLLKNPNGVVLVTGPTGCGKTTTLYAGVVEINNPDVKVITVEDPVEYEIKGLVQVQVQEKVNMTFASALRSILRQDPDIILIGEIRDVETAEIAVQSALTGHLVLSTTHTNEAAGAVTRLIDMGVDTFLLTSTIRGILAQRLVRINCSECSEQYTPDPEDIRKLGKNPDDVKDVKFFKGKGCPHCAKTGFHGRVGIFELLEMTPEIEELVLNHQPANIIHKTAVEQGMLTMAEDGWMKALSGMTSVEEILRVAPGELKTDKDLAATDMNK